MYLGLICIVFSYGVISRVSGYSVDIFIHLSGSFVSVLTRASGCFVSSCHLMSFRMYRTLL